MNISEAFALGLLASGPLAILIGFGRTVMFLDRSIRRKGGWLAAYALAIMLALLTLLTVIIAVWFGYGVAHTGKDEITDLIVLSATLLPAYAYAFGAWRLSRYLERRLITNG